MDTSSEEKLTNQTPPEWLINILPFISSALAGGALWLAWFKYNHILNQTEFHWYTWIQPALLALVGILCLLATILFILGKSSGWSVFMSGLSIVPLILFSNLVILLFRVIQNIAQGNTKPFISRLYASPLDKTILTVAVLGFLLSLFNGIRTKNNN